MPEHKSFRLDIPLVLSHEIGRDPEQEPDYVMKQIAGTKSAMICESLFWVVEQLGYIAHSQQKGAAMRAALLSTMPPSDVRQAACRATCSAKAR